MTPITSLYDVRLATLFGVTISVIETLALELDTNPEQLLAEYLYLTNRKLHEVGEEVYINKLTDHFITRFSLKQLANFYYAYIY